MAGHEAPDVWSYTRGQLPEEERARIEAHLAGCAECRSALEAARAAQGVLAEARAPSPRVDWRRVDDRVLGAAARRLARVERGPRWVWAGLGLGLAAAAVLLMLWRTPAGPGGGEVVPPAEVARSEGGASSVESSTAAERWQGGAAGEALAAGQVLAPGAGVRTGPGGSATLRLPDASRVRVGEGSALVLARATRDEVELSLARGRMVAQAAHVPRKAFQVRAGGVVVHVVGTVFGVVASRREVEVAVAEGRVRVELPGGAPRSVGAGERLVVEQAGRVRTGGLTAADRAEFRKLGVEGPPAASRAERPRSAGGAAPSPQVREAPPPAPEASVDGTGAVPEGAVAKAASSPEPSPPGPPPAIAPEEGWAPLPVAREAAPPAARSAPAPGPAGREKLPDTVEAIFLRRAEESLRTGGCQRFLLGLEELLERPGAPAVRGQARILRARCFDDQLQPDRARREYYRYLEEFPDGPFTIEARQATGRIDGLSPD